MMFPSAKKVEEAKKEIDSVIDNLLRLEKKWRELAYFIQKRKEKLREAEKKGDRVEASLLKHEIVFNFNTSIPYDTYEIYQEKIPKIFSLISSLSEIDKKLSLKATDACSHLYTAYEYLGRLHEKLSEIVFNIKDFDEQYERGRKALAIMQDFCSEIEGKMGRKVCFFDYSKPEERTFSASANDIASTFHRIAEEFIEVKKEMLDKLGEKKTKRVYVREGASKKAIDMCMTFDRAVEWAYDQGLIEVEDYNVQLCIASDDEAIMRLGSSPGHGAHIYSDGKLEYYDTDKKVNETLKTILEKYAECSCEVKENGVFCSKCDPIKASSVITLAISMDLRGSYEKDIETAKEMLKDVLYL